MLATIVQTMSALVHQHHVMRVSSIVEGLLEIQVDAFKLIE
jgi:hypothetical protein